MGNNNFPLRGNDLQVALQRLLNDVDKTIDFDKTIKKFIVENNGDKINEYADDLDLISNCNFDSIDLVKLMMGLSEKINEDLLTKYGLQLAIEIDEEIENIYIIEIDSVSVKIKDFKDAIKNHITKKAKAETIH